MDSSEFFFQITPDRILEAVEQFGFRCTGRTLTLNSLENRVYEVEIEIDDEQVKSPSDRFKIVKFYRPGRWSREQIEEEHQFLLDLIEKEVPAVAPLVINGSTIAKAPGTEIYCTVFPKRGGRHPDEFTDPEIEQLGRLMARLHSVGVSREAPHRLALNPHQFGTLNLEFLLTSKKIPLHIEREYERTVREIVDLSKGLFEGVPVQRIHGDCHLANILWGSEGLYLVDFDDMVRGPCIQDLWLILPGRDDYSKGQFGVFLDAYEEMRDFPRQSCRLIEPLRALRMIHFSAWIAKRWEDPIFPRVFVDFGTDHYWQDQLRFLDDQLRLIRAI